MQINLAKSAGFCFGVKRALDIAFKTRGAQAKVYMLGDIVHNEKVVQELERARIKKIKKLAPSRNRTLLIRAHGSGLNTLEKAQRLGYKIVDATCPMVKEIHKIARDMEEKGYQISVIGDKRHDEVQGIVGQLKNKAIVIDNIKDIPLKMLKGIKKVCVVVQSTQNLENVFKIVKVLKRHVRDLKFFNTVCRPTRMKQQEIRKMPLENAVMIIIGSKSSANTRRLYEISKSLNKRSYWVSSKEEIDLRWFKDAKNVGVTAGASTPESTIKDILEYISADKLLASCIQRGY